MLNRPAPGGPVKSYRPPPPPRPRPLDRVPAPVIISSYASSVVQGGSKEEQRRIQETFDKYEKLNEIPTEDVEEKEEEEDEQETVTEPIEEDIEILKTETTQDQKKVTTTAKPVQTSAKVEQVEEVKNEAEVDEENGECF